MKISIDELCPGERDIWKAKVDTYKKKLEDGEPIDPVRVIEIGGRQYVRNGGHRVRATIDYCEAKGIKPEIEFVDGSEPAINPLYPATCQRIADEFGCGVEAFKKIPYQ
jgi:hypothetical protein